MHMPHQKIRTRKKRVCVQLEEAYNSVLKYDLEIVIGDFNVKIGRKEVFRSNIGRFSKHGTRNDSGKMPIGFVIEHGLRIRVLSINTFIWVLGYPV